MNTDPTNDVPSDDTGAETSAANSVSPGGEPASPAENSPSSESAAPLRDRLKSAKPAPPATPTSASPPAAAQQPTPASPQRPPSPKPVAKPADRPRRDDEDAQVRAKPAPPAPRVPVPSRRQLQEDFDRELDSALGGQSMDELLAKSDRVTSEPTIDQESRLAATVVRIHRDNIFFALGGPNEGVASLRQFAVPPEIGARLEVVVTSYNPEDGLYEVSVPGASISVGDWTDLMEGALVEARVTAANTGGLECMVNQIRAFIPASQVALYRVENLTDFIDQKMLCVVTEANPQRQNLVLSRRSVLEREKEEARRNLLESLKEGHICEGIVRNIRDFGAFVDLGGVDGLIHISQLSWDRVNHPSDVLEVGQKVRVRIEKIDPETNKIGLSLRTLQEHPWEKASQLFAIGTTTRGTVSRIAKFGAFVKLSPGIEGLIHISELSHQRVSNVSQVLQEGQEVQVKVVSLDVENQRIGLSLKALTAAAAQAEEPETEAEPDAAERAPAAPRQRGPLRGGLERGSGGDQFGLKW